MQRNALVQDCFLRLLYYYDLLFGDHHFLLAQICFLSVHTHYAKEIHMFKEKTKAIVDFLIELATKTSRLLKRSRSFATLGIF